MTGDSSTIAAPSADIDRYLFATRFLAIEARLLDERRFDEWIGMVDDQVVYEVPVRQARMEFAEEFIAGAFRLQDDMALLKVRVERLRSKHAWAETPPSRTLRLVGSVLVEPTDAPDIVAVESALLLYRQRGHGEGDLIPVRRSDTIRVTTSGGALLSRRSVIPDIVLQTPNLGVFL